MSDDPYPFEWVAFPAVHDDGISWFEVNARSHEKMAISCCEKSAARDKTAIMVICLLGAATEQD
ncbi:hypothetical protein GCM10008018_25000 [Paenibacillus marchantiophytorum]|uniref:Uncharacterized protein n=1 Tax=Paenibacillus marchantiophytorum TaxID=1619310 RepID=A0ABQ1EMC8_9BACL|nr:hypothetical protein GCM10008018_25000 [Paenibacillus marchantiophytorum]